MGLHTPFLFGEDRAHGFAGGLTVRANVDSAMVDVSVHGRWSRHLQILATTGIGKCFAENPRAVLVDLYDLGDPDAASAPTWFTAALRGGALQPPVHLVLSLPTTAPLARRLGPLGGASCLSMYATLPEARAATARRLPPAEPRQLRLAPTPHAARLALDLVGEACASWSLKELAHPARLVACELVHNAVEHARTPIVFSVSKRGRVLHLAVADADPRLPRLIGTPPIDPACPWDVGGQGLRVVDRAATAWGAMPTADGKVVWATFQGGKVGRRSPHAFPRCARAS